MRKFISNPVKTLLLLLGIGIFVGDILFTGLINPASDWLYSFNIPIINISFGVLTMFGLVIYLFVTKLFGNNPDT